jgi:ABC-type lipoprotein export system ATPase subunit
MGEHAISVRGLTKRFGVGRGARTVLDRVDLDVERHQMVAILGRSGTGKSTLLHLIGGLDRPDTGAITVAGARVDRMDESGLTELRRHRVGFVFQFFHLLPELTGRENVCLPLRLSGDGHAGGDRADQLIARLAVAHVAGALPTTMSGGEQQRLAIARALVNQPDVVLADEPTGNLDQESGHEVLRLLREVADDGRAVLVVTHDMEAAQLADTVMSLRDGRLEAE